MEKSNSHPKPSDEVQLNIETVTPDTEKDGLANDQKNKEESIAPVATLKEKEANKVEPSAENPDKEPNEVKPDENDARAQIETISP